MLAKRLAILSIILSLAVFLPKPAFAQTPPSCPSGMNRYYNSYLCTTPEAISFCADIYDDIGVNGPTLRTLISRENFFLFCLEKLSANTHNVNDFCQGFIINLSRQACVRTLENFFTRVSNWTNIKVSGLTSPVYSPDCDGGNGVKTGLGCLSTNPQILVNTVLPWAIGIGSGIAFLLGLYGALMIVISAGDPEKMQAGKEMITSAVSGLLIIIFAVFILRVIGVDILQLFDVNNN